MKLPIILLKMYIKVSHITSLESFQNLLNIKKYYKKFENILRFKKKKKKNVESIQRTLLCKL